jgi:lysozyme family protein
MALEGVLLTDDPNDPGGPTRFGFSQLGYPEEDIANLTYDKARTLCRRDYWNPLGCDGVLYEPMQFQLLESMFHMDPPRHPYRSVLIVQLSLIVLGSNIELDGLIGPRTRGAINSFRSPLLLNLLANIMQMSFLFVGNNGDEELIDLIDDRLPTLRRYMLGWLRRFESV